MIGRVVSVVLLLAVACAGDLESPSGPPGDADGDGIRADEDCNDDDATVFPGAPEICDGVDNDCDDLVDDDDELAEAPRWYRDLDGDGFGSGGGMLACEEPASGFTAEAGDCDDNDETVSPDALEVCDTIDNDCDDLVDDDDDDVDTSTGAEFWVDDDGDGFGDPERPVFACRRLDGLADNPNDCDDLQDVVRPGVAEVCDAIDNDCDGLVDDEDPDRDPSVAPLHYVDADRDGFGNPSTGIRACRAPQDTVSIAGDCDDGSAAISPDATEICDSVDNDCDNAIDDADPSLDASQGGVTSYTDSDRDGFGDPTTALVTCLLPPDRSTTGEDCDDTRDDVFPGAEEYCDGVRNDCTSPQLDEDGLASWTDPSGRVDVTGLLTGTDSEEAQAVFGTDGQLALCEDTWYASITILGGANVEVRGYGTSRDAVRVEGVNGSPIEIDDAGSTVTIEGLTVAGAGGSAYGIRCASSAEPHVLTMRDVRVTDNVLVGNAALSADRCTTSLQDVEIDGNAGSAALEVTKGSLLAQRVDVHDNTSDSAGGGLLLGVGLHQLDDVQVRNNVVDDPSGTPGGGGILIDLGATVELTGGIVEGNLCPGSGGGILSFGELTLLDTTIRGNTAAQGGGIAVNGGELLARRSTLTGNLANVDVGGGLVVSDGSNVRLETCTLTANEAATTGGAIWASPQGTLLDVQDGAFGATGTPEDNLPHDVSWDTALTLQDNETFCFGPRCP